MHNVCKILAFVFLLTRCYFTYCSYLLPTRCTIRAKITIDNDGNYFGSFKLANHSELRTLNDETFYYYLSPQKGSHNRTFIDPIKVPSSFQVMFSAVHKKAMEDCNNAQLSDFKSTKLGKAFITSYSVTNHFEE